MKKLTLIFIGLFIFTFSHAQDYTQQEVICPCMLEFDFPKTIEDGNGLLQAFGGVPVLRFEKAKIEGKKLICEYETAFAKFFFDGFGIVTSSGNLNDLSDVPYDLTLTLNESLLHEWTPSRKTVKLPNYHRGCVVYTLDRCAEDGKYSWKGAFYKSEYNGNKIAVYRTFTDAARVNTTNTGFILAKTTAGLYTATTTTKPDINNDPTVLKKKKREKRKK